MNTFAYLVLAAWPFVGTLMPLAMRAERAAIATLLLGWLFLPVAGFEIGVFNFTRVNVLSLGLLGGLLFASERVMACRPSWWDLPMLCWLAAAPLSSYANDYGAYDAASALFYRTLGYGVPYFCGRVLLAGRRGMHDLLVGLFGAGMLYLPLVWYELKMSPLLHLNLYGFFQHSWDQHFRGGGYRPIVFVEHGLVLSLFMAVATLAGYVLWRRGLRRVFNVPTWVPVALLAVTVVLCKSMGAMILMMLGWAMLRESRRPWVFAFALAVVPAFILVRAGSSIGLDWVLRLAEWISPERASSMAYRWINEELLLPNITQNFWFGSPYYFGEILDSEGDFQTVVVDSLWIIALASNGLFGLFGAIGMLWIPVAGVLRMLMRSGRRAVDHPAGPLGIVVALNLIDCLSNAFVAPIYLMIAGAVVGMLAARTPESRQAVPAPPIAQANQLNQRISHRIGGRLRARPRVGFTTGGIE